MSNLIDEIKRYVESTHKKGNKIALAYWHEPTKMLTIVYFPGSPVHNGDLMLENCPLEGVGENVKLRQLEWNRFAAILKEHKISYGTFADVLKLPDGSRMIWNSLNRQAVVISLKDVMTASNSPEVISAVHLLDILSAEQSFGQEMATVTWGVEKIESEEIVVSVIVATAILQELDINASRDMESDYKQFWSNLVPRPQFKPSASGYTLSIGDYSSVDVDRRGILKVRQTFANAALVVPSKRILGLERVEKTLLDSATICCNYLRAKSFDGDIWLVLAISNLKDVFLYSDKRMFPYDYQYKDQSLVLKERSLIGDLEMDPRAVCGEMLIRLCNAFGALPTSPWQWSM